MAPPDDPKQAEALIQKIEALDEIIEIQCSLWQATLLDILRDLRKLLS